MSFKLSKKDIIVSYFPHVGIGVPVQDILDATHTHSLGTVRVWLSQIRKDTGISLRIRRGMIVRDA